MININKPMNDELDAEAQVAVQSVVWSIVAAGGALLGSVILFLVMQANWPATDPSTAGCKWVHSDGTGRECVTK